VLNSYLTQVSRLLHDPNYKFFSTTELTDYVNEARNRVAEDTKALRFLVTNATYPATVLTAGVELYQYAAFMPAAIAPYLVDFMGIHLYWGNTRWPLTMMSFTEFNIRLRAWNNLQQRPLAWARMGANQFYVGPIPDQNYAIDVDICIVPNALVSDATPEQIPVPFQEPVQYYAAFKAKHREQALGEATYFETLYQKILRKCAVAFNTRMTPNPYLG
jgi:hypothetical protein